MTPQSPEPGRPLEDLRRFLRLVGRMEFSKTLLAAALLLSVAGTLTNLVVPFFTKNLVDGFRLSTLGTAQIAGIAAFFVLSAAVNGVSTYLLNRTGQTVVASLRKQLWEKLLNLPIPYFNRVESGETVSRLTNDTAVVKGLISEHMSGFVNGIISITGSVIVLFYLDWRMTLMLVVVLPVAFAVLGPLGRRMYKISVGIQQETAAFTAVTSRVLSEIRLVKASNAEQAEYRSGREGIDRLFRFGLKEARVQAFIFPVMSVVMMLLMAVIIGYGGTRVSSGAITAGELVAFILYLMQILMPISQITQFITQFQKASGATESLLHILGQTEEKRAEGENVTDLNRPIRLENVSFTYPGAEAVLHDVSLELPPGRVTAIVGPSGSGKTTLFALLERFYQPSEGRILLDGRDAAHYSIESWRRAIGYVSQESPILSGTIRENLTYGLDRTPSQEELEEAAAMAYADGFIRELPQGYETQVGERGIKLSGGQRQRLAIARAILRNPRLLMLDEATSSLDSQSELVVQEALHNLMKGRTTLVIAHRLSTVVGADQILFLEKGRLTGRGTHTELVESHPLYREFALHQLRMNGERKDFDEGEGVADGTAVDRG